MRRACALMMALVGCGGVELAPRKPVPLDRASLPAAPDPNAAPREPTMPLPGEPELRPVPVPKEARLSNGVRVLMLEQHQIPLVAIGVTLARGSVDARPGVFRAFAESLTSGSDLIAPDALQGNYFHFATRHELDVRLEATDFAVECISTVLPTVVRMTVHTFAAPTFDGKAFATILDQRKRAAARLHDEPGARATREVYRLLYPDHPYREGEADIPSAFDGLTAETMRGMQGAVGADDVAVVAAGDFAPERLLPLLEEALHGLRPTATPRATLKEVAAGPAHVLALDHPGDSQARIALGFLGVRFDDPDYPALYALARIVGSRARDNLRLAHGLTYEASGELPRLHKSAPVIITAAVDVGQVRAALGDTFQALREAADLGQDAVRFAHIKRWLLSSWPSANDTVMASTRRLETLVELGLPVDWWAKLRDTVAALGAEDLARVAAKYLDPAHAQLVVLGDVARFRADLTALAIGPVEVRSVH